MALVAFKKTRDTNDKLEEEGVKPIDLPDKPQHPLEQSNESDREFVDDMVEGSKESIEALADAISDGVSEGVSAALLQHVRVPAVPVEPNEEGQLMTSDQHLAVRIEDGGEP